MDVAPIVSEVIAELEDFISGPLRNKYIYDSQYIVQLYTRKGHHSINGKIADTIDIANLVIEGGYRGNGIGSALIDAIHEANPFSHTYVESLLNTSLYFHLKRNGWHDVVGSTPPSVFKCTNNESAMFSLLKQDRTPQVERNPVCHMRTAVVGSVPGCVL